MTRLNALVSGGGIAGSVVAYWLGVAGVSVTVVEKSSALRTSGQGVDIRGEALKIVNKMGVEGEIRKHTTSEVATSFIDEKGSRLATIGVDGGKSFTSEIEIIRSDLARIFYNKSISTGNVQYKFGLSIIGLSQHNSKVVADFDNDKSETFDLVIAADGLGSRVRKLVLGPELFKSSFYSLNAYVAYFSVPREDRDGSEWLWYTTTGRRAVSLRPRDTNLMSAYLTVLTTSPDVAAAAKSSSISDQKSVVKKFFSTDALWHEMPRIVSAMDAAGSDDFYFQDIAQVRLDPRNWHAGNVALVGDAAYCPTPFTGMGTSLAILGAYVLAGEIVKQIQLTETDEKVDCEAAFRRYEGSLGTYVKHVQNLPLGGRFIYLVNPETWIGVWILRTVLWIADRSGFLRLITMVLGGEVKEDGFALPDYHF